MNPLGRYTEAAKAHQADDKEGAARKLSEALGADKTLEPVRESIDSLFDPESPMMSPMLRQMMSEERKAMEEEVKEDEVACSVPLIPIAQWLQEEEEGECRPCVLAVLIGEYQKELNKHPELSERIAKALDSSESNDPILGIAEELDKIKEVAEPGLRQRLRSLDCLALTNKLE